MNTLELIKEERERQIKKGFDSQHDDQEVYGELAMGAIVRAMPDNYRDVPIVSNAFLRDNLTLGKVFWPYREGYKPSPYRKEELIKAAAMLVAEIERLDRLSTK